MKAKNSTEISNETVTAEDIKENADNTEAAADISEDATDNEKGGLKEIWLSFFKWTIIAVIVGIVDGGAGAAFHHCLDFATEFRTEHSFLIYLLPIAGLAIVFLYSICGMKEDKGTNTVILAARGRENVKFRMMPLIFTAAFLTHFCGGSAGREGAALQIGASTVSPLRKILKMDDRDYAVLTMCGMAAGFSALFGTPGAAAVFAMEVALVGAAQYTAVIPCFTASAAASIVGSLLGVIPTSFEVSGIPVLDGGAALTLLKVVFIGLLCALVSILFCEAMHLAGKLYNKFIPNAYLRIAAGGIIVILLTLIVGNRDYNGAGMDVINRAFAGNAFPVAFLLKMIFTALTLGAGFKGGEIVPSFFVGATLGCTAASLIGLDPSFGAALGLIGVFCGVTNCPLASVILSAELFGGGGLIFFAAAAAVSYMLSGYEGLYSEQRFLFSKSRLSIKEKSILY